MSNDKFNKYCEQLLIQYKRRNTKAVTRHLGPGGGTTVTCEMPL